MNEESAEFCFDVNQSPFFVKDERNFINVVGQKQLNTLKNVSLLDMYLSNEEMIEPHYHQSASEFIYCVSGGVTVSILNPSTKEIINCSLTSGQVTNIPQGWWHYILATANQTHLLGIFDEPNPKAIFGADILTGTPANIMAHAYCLDQQKWNETIAPIQPSMIIGPPKDCSKSITPGPYENHQVENSYSQQMQPYSYYQARNVDDFYG